MRLEGNGIMISGFNQYTSISGNHIAYTGDSAIAGWGCSTSHMIPKPPLYFKLAQNLDLRCVLLSDRCWGSQPKHVSNPYSVIKKPDPICFPRYTSGSDPHQPKGTGPDGTEGNFPRWTLIENNFIHHLGIHEKQSSCWFQASAAGCATRLGNLF